MLKAGSGSSVFVGVDLSFSIRNSDLPQHYDRNRNYIYFSQTTMWIPFEKKVVMILVFFDLGSGIIYRWDWKGRLLKLPQPAWFTKIRKQSAMALRGNSTSTWVYYSSTPELLNAS